MPYTIAEAQLALAYALDDVAASPSGEIRSLVRIARVLEAVPDPEIDPAFALRLEARLMTEGLDELSARRIRATSPLPMIVEPPRPESSGSELAALVTASRAPSRDPFRASVVTLPRGRFVVRKVLAATVAAAMLFALPVVASGSALPGSPFYGVKVARERMELVIAKGPIADGFVYLKHAGRRLDEVEQIMALGRAALAAPTLRRYDVAIARGTQLILSATSDPAILARLASQLARGTGHLSRLLTLAPSVIAPAIIESIESGRALSLEVESVLAVADATPAAGSVAPAAGAPALPAGTALPVGVDPAAAAGPASANPGRDMPADDGNKPVATGSRGAHSSCAGMIVRDPSNTNRTACAAVETLQDHPAGSAASHDATDGPVAGCPAPTTCGLYALDGYRWAAKNGVAIVPFVVNPTQPWVASADATAAARAAAATWANASPAVRLDYRGTTTSLPTLGDGINQIGWGNPGTLNTVAQANILRIGNRVIEADVVLTVTLPWGTSGIVNRYDIRSIVTHEFGHWLGVADVASTQASEQSMFAKSAPGETKQTTLALGDVRAVRAAYPCGACPMPGIQDDRPAEPASAAKATAPSAAPAAGEPTKAKKQKNQTPPGRIKDQKEG